MDTDPWSWSAEQVAHFFRTEAAGVIQDKPNSQLPDLPSLAQTLLDEGVAGADLLTQVDSNFLKEDCGIRQLGKRSSVIYCISRLRSQSDDYQQKDSAPGIQTPQSLHVLPPQPPSLLQQPLPTSALDSPGQHVRSGEVSVQDQKGRKRRKLDLSRPIEKTPAGGFMADAGFPVDSLFYGRTQFSREIGDLEPAGEIQHSQADSNPDQEVFQFVSNQRPGGDVHYVYRQVKHLFMNDRSKRIRRRGRDAVAIFPYREHLLLKGKAVSATVFVPDDNAEDDCMAVRENAAFLDEEVDYYNESTEQQHTDGTWDYLTKNWTTKPDEEVLPEYGQSDDEDNEMASDFEREVDEEEAEKQQAAADRPDKDDMERIMEESVDALAQTWREKNVSRLEEKQAWTVWKKMRGSKMVRDGLIAGARQQVRSFDERLKKQKRWIMDESWTNADKLKEQCQIMEATVEDREHMLWKIDVWHRKQEPFHVVRHGHSSTSDTAKQTGTHHNGFMPQPGDRLSVEPAEERDEEVFHTPEGSLAGDEDDDGEHGDDEQDGAADDMDVDTPDDSFVVHDSSLDPITTDPNSSPLPVTPSVRKQNGPRAPSSTPRRSREQTIDEDSDSDPLPELPKMPKSSSQRVKPELLKTPTKKLAFSNSQSNPVVLSSDSETPPSKLAGKKKGAKGKVIALSADPLSDKKADVDSWDMNFLIGKGDRIRILIKLLAQAGHEQRKLIHSHIAKLRRLGFKSLLKAALADFEKDPLYEGEDEQTTIGAYCARLYMTYASLRMELMDGAFDIDPTLAGIMRDTQQVEIFTGNLEGILKRSDTALFNPPKPKPKSNRSSSILGSSPKSVIDLMSDEELSEDEYQRILKHTPRKKRKREIKESQSAVQSQNNAAKRMERYHKTQTSNSQQLVAMVQRDPTNSKISINPVKNEDDESIFVHQPIAQVMKGHQIDGVRFMWREVTADDGDGTDPQGCLLTHTMGLGKTMQTIAVLVAVNEAAQSEDLKVSSQLPPQLRLNAERERQLRMMVLCPPALIENWRKEIKRWANKVLPNVFCIESGSNKNHLDDMRTWYRIGGVLIIGYDLFRNKVHRKESKSAKANLANNRDGAEIDKCLLQGPELVVADEVHNLRNRNAKSLAVEGIETHSRIGLSGTPLSNNVDEIYALISFVSPGYLGEPNEFKSRYAQPIQQGLYDDSTRYEKRKSLIKLAVLQDRIEPKVNRADINSLRGFIPPKTEFVLTLPLTSIQQIAYARFVSAVLGNKQNEKASQVQIFAWLDILGLLTTHPLAFKNKLLKPIVKKGSARATTPQGSMISNNGDVDIDDSVDLADQAVLTLGFSQETVDEIVEGINDVLEVHKSAKMTMLMNILELSAAAGDKVLVFSGSLGTLDTVEQILHDRGIDCGRIDGKIPPPKRLQVIAEFDKSKTKNVLLCSTRASGVGLNIQGANRVVILDFGFNPTHEEQAVGRAYRLGQQKPVFVYRMVMGSTFEEHIYNKQLFKQSLFQRVVDRKNPRRVAKKNTREFLYEPQHVPQKNVSQWVGKDDKVLDQILRRELQAAEASGNGDTIIRDLTTYETLQEDAGDEPLDEQERKERDEEIEANKRGGFVFRPIATNSASQAGAAPPATAPAPGLNAKSVRITNAVPKQNVKRTFSGGKPGRPSSADRNGMMAPPPGSARPAAPASMPHGLPMPQPPPASMPNQRQQRPPGQN